MPLPPPVSRQPSHTRTVVYRGFDRDDGLWDIEAELTDIKHFPYGLLRDPPLEPGQPMHGLSIRLTIDPDFVVRAVATSMDHIPHAPCEQAPANMHRLVGCRMAQGWRKQVEERVGGSDGCTHLREMLGNMATAAIQTLTSGEWYRRERRGEPHPPDLEMPPFLGACHNWALDGESTRQHFPMFYRPREHPPE